MANEPCVTVEERLAAALLLSFVGGFTDVYSYLFRGHVFANAVTGNMVLLGVNLAAGLWTDCLKYLFAIAAYGCGVFAANVVHARLGGARRISWHQSVLALEAVLLAAAVFVPVGRGDCLVNATIAFVCALQVQTFRRVRGLPFASTMCTGNLRSGSEALYRGLAGEDAAGLGKARHYFCVIGVFISGAVAGALLLKRWGAPVFILAPAALVLASALLVTARQRVFLRRLRRRLVARFTRR